MNSERVRANARMLYWSLKGSRLAKVDEPYIAKCNQCVPGSRKTFVSEKAARVWAAMHTADMKIMDALGTEHKPVFAMKASVK